MFDLGRTLIAAAARNPEALALVDGASRLTYRDLLHRASCLVTGFDELGLRHGDRLLIIMQNRAEFAILHWATQLAGVIATPINWRASAEEISYFLENSGAQVLAFDDAAQDAVASCAAAQALQRIATRVAAGGTIQFDDLVQRAAADDVPRAASNDISLMLYTSGTTGQGKGGAAQAPQRACRCHRPRRPKPLRQWRDHARRYAALSHDGRPLVAGDGRDQWHVCVPAAI